MEVEEMANYLEPTSLQRDQNLGFDILPVCEEGENLSIDFNELEHNKDQSIEIEETSDVFELDLVTD
ncbi:6064_t:CDS:2 [Racocetra fulgida]|uniref:6064_t:CDS:1 n=1 Tax=Racocetra fulgida TaxID=60492 RepID=A0A9N8W2V8_9GLOM|nr:6064_t:CDS:2 [Racocetra fulgida]